MNELPHFEKGQILTADELNAVVDYIKKHTVSVGPGLTMEQSPSGTVISALQQQQLRKSMIAPSRTRLPFEIYIKTNAAGTQTVYCDGNVLKQNYAVEGRDINSKGFTQFGIFQSKSVPENFTGTYAVYVRYNQTGATGIGLLIEEKETAPDETVFIGRVKFTNGVPEITQYWTGGISFVSIDPHQVSITWPDCPRYNSHGN